VVGIAKYTSRYGFSRDDTSPERRCGRFSTMHEVVHLEDGRTITISREPIPGGGWVTTYQDVIKRR
jgi:hypothetical protein